MNSLLGPRVKETSTTTGTGTLSLDGAVSGFQTFVAGIGTGNQCYYTIIHGTAWEVGQGTVTDLATDTLSRDTVLASSAGGAKLNLGVGTKTVFVDVTRESIAVLGGHLFGLACNVNATDPSNDIDITAGQCTSDDASEANRVVISPTAMTKRIDATWQAGSGMGGRLSSDALGASATWHLFAFKPAASPDDFFFSTSVNPTPPSGSKKRRILSLKKGSSAWIPFQQDGDLVMVEGTTPGLDVNANTTGNAPVTYTTSCPTGIEVDGLFNVHYSSSSGRTVYLISDLDTPAATPSESAAPLANGWGLAATTLTTQPIRCRTNTSAQIRFQCNDTGGNVLRIFTAGWIDRRGRDA